jgi:hypothetical protein
MLRTASSPSANPPSMRQRRRASSRLDVVTLAALRDLLTPPVESEAEAERLTAAIMARIHATVDAATEARAGVVHG